MIQFLVACAIGIVLLAAVGPKLHVVPMTRVDRVPTKAAHHAEHRKSTTSLLPPEQQAAAERERRFALRQLDADETILHASSYNARADAYCRSEVGKPVHLTMGFSGGRSGEEVEAYYRKLLTIETRTREQELARQQELEAAGNMVANYEVGVQQCKGMLLNEIAHMPSDEELQLEIKSSKAQILDFDTSGPELVTSAR